MPYRNTSELPSEIKKKYKTAKERRAFMKAFNSTHDACLKKGKSAASCEGSAFASGHSAAQGVKSTTDSVDEKQGIVENGNIEGWLDVRLTQVESEYVPTGGTSEAACANCRWFNPYGMSCHLVQGVIVPTGISDRYEPMPSLYEDETGDFDLDDFDDVIEEYESKSLLTGIKETITNTINSLLGNTKSLDDYFDTPTGFKMLSDNRWIAWYTNAYEDRDGEWFAEKAIEADIDRMNETGEYPELWHWHIKGTKHGQADWAGMIGRFAVASGTFDNTPTARKFKAHYRKKDMMLSHGFSYDPEEYKDKTYHAFKTFEISTLPPGREANSLTSFGVKQGELAMSKLTKEQVLSLVNVVGEEEARKMIQQGKDATKDADTTHRYKATSKPNEEDVEEEEKTSYEKKMDARMSKLEEKMDALAKKLDGKPKEEEKQATAPNPTTSTESPPPIPPAMMQMFEQMQANMKSIQEKQTELDTHVKSVQGAGGFNDLMADFAANRAGTEPALSYGQKMFLQGMGLMPTEGDK